MKYIFSKSRTLLLPLFTSSLMLFLFGFVSSADAQSLIPCGGTDCTFDHFIQLIQNVINFLLVTIAIPLATILFSYAGWLYLSAAGDSGKISQAHEIFKNVVLGLVLALAAWLIVNTIANALLDKSVFKDRFLFLKQTSVIEHKIGEYMFL